MKTFYVLFFLLLQFTNSLYGQSWFNGNPHWTNRYYGGMGGQGTEFVHISGDTILSGKPAKIFSKTMYGDSGFLNYQQQRYAYQSGDTIFSYKDGAFAIMYNFSLMPGDTFFSKVYVSGGLSHVFVIDSVGQIEISGQALRFQKVRLIPPNTPNHQNKICKNTIIEKIGMVNGTLNLPPSPLIYTWPDHFFMDETFLFGIDFPGWHFCNYSNDSLSGYYSEGIGVDITCHTLVTSSLPDVLDASSEVRLYPNPANGNVFIENFEPEQVQLFDQRGALVRQAYTAPAAHFSVAGLPSGCYIVKMSNQDRVVLRKVWVE